MKSLKEKDKENNKQSPRKAKPAPDFSKLHKQWDSKLQKGKAVTKKPLTDSQPFQLTSTAKYVSPKRDHSFHVNEKAMESILDGKGIPRSIKKNRTTISEGTRGVCRSSIPRPSFGCQAAKSSLHNNKSSEPLQHLTFLPLEKEASAVKVNRTNCSAVTSKVVFEGSYIEEKKEGKEGKEIDEEEEKKNLLKNRSAKAQQLQGFSVDFKTDSNALKSILTEEGIPFFNTPAKRSSQFGPLRKRSSERVAPFSRLSNAKKPIGRTTLGASRANNLGVSQLHKPRWSIFSRDSFSTKPDLLTWLKELAENPNFRKSMCKEDILIKSSTGKDLQTTSDKIELKSKFNETVVGYQGGACVMPINRSILKDSNTLEKIAEHTSNFDVQQVSMEFNHSSRSMLSKVESLEKIEREKLLVPFSQHLKVERYTTNANGIFDESSIVFQAVPKNIKQLVSLDNNNQTAQRIPDDLKYSYSTMVSPCTSIDLKRATSTSAMKKVHWADSACINLTKEVSSVCSQPTSHQIQFVMPAEHPLDKSFSPKTLVNDYIQKISSTKVNNQPTSALKSLPVISWSDVLQEELLSNLNTTSGIGNSNEEQPSYQQVDFRPVPVIPDHFVNNFKNNDFKDGVDQFNSNSNSSFLLQNSNLQSTLMVTPLNKKCESGSLVDYPLVELTCTTPLIELSESITPSKLRTQARTPYKGKDSKSYSDAVVSKITCTKDTDGIKGQSNYCNKENLVESSSGIKKTKHRNSYLEKICGDYFSYISEDESPSQQSSEQNVQVFVDKSITNKKNKKSKHRNSYLEKICGDYFTYISEDESPSPKSFNNIQSSCSLELKFTTNSISVTDGKTTDTVTPSSELESSNCSLDKLKRNSNCPDSLNNEITNVHIPNDMPVRPLINSMTNENLTGSNVNDVNKYTRQMNDGQKFTSDIFSSNDHSESSQSLVTISQYSPKKTDILTVSISSPKYPVINSSIVNIRSPSMLLFPQSTIQFGKVSLSSLPQESPKSSILRPSKLLESKEVKNDVNDNSNNDHLSKIPAVLDQAVKYSESELLSRFASLSTNNDGAKYLTKSSSSSDHQNVLKPSLLAASLNQSQKSALKNSQSSIKNSQSSIKNSQSSIKSCESFLSNSNHPLFTQAQFPMNPLFKTQVLKPDISDSGVSPVRNSLYTPESAVDSENDDNDDADLCVVFSKSKSAQLHDHPFQRIAFPIHSDGCLPSEENVSVKKNLIGASEDLSAFRHIAPRCNVFPRIFSTISASKPSEQLKKLQLLVMDSELPNKYDAMLDAEVSVCSKFVEINQMFIKNQMGIRHGALDPVSQLLTYGDGKHFVPISLYA